MMVYFTYLIILSNYYIFIVLALLFVSTWQKMFDP